MCAHKISVQQNKVLENKQLDNIEIKKNVIKHIQKIERAYPSRVCPFGVNL